MRKINLKQFLRILKGEDLEFRITSFSFKIDRAVFIEDIHLPYDLDFSHCEFENVQFNNCHFSGDFQLNQSKSKSLSFHNCQLQNLTIVNSTLNSVEICDSRELRELIIRSSNITSIDVLRNPIYETLHLGCENNIRNCQLLDNGAPEKNSFATKVFICPEKFEIINIERVTSDLLHIGNFGQYAHMQIKDVNSEVVFIDNCSTELSKVSFVNVRPLDKETGAFHLVNTAFDQEVFDDSAFKNYKTTKIHHRSIDPSEVMT